MAIEGPISELALSDLLQLLHLSRRSGALTASGGSVGTTTLYLDDGSLTGATSSAPELRLGRLLVGSGVVTSSQVAAALDYQRQSRPAARIGEILVDQGSATVRDVEASLRFQIDEAVLELMRWQEGYLRFADATPPQAGKIGMRAATDAVLMEAARRLDELHELVGSPTLDPLPHLAEGEGRSGYVHLTAREWEVLGEVDGKRSLRGIAHSLGRSQLDVARSLYELASNGIVELRRGVSDPFAATRPELLLARVDAAIEDGNIGDASALLHEARGSAAEVDLLVREARIAALAKDWFAAGEALAAALEREPDRAESYYYLARVCLLQSDPGGAELALQRYIELGDLSERRNISAVRMMDSIRALRRAAMESTP